MEHRTQLEVVHCNQSQTLAMSAPHWTLEQWQSVGICLAVTLTGYTLTLAHSTLPGPCLLQSQSIPRPMLLEWTLDLDCQ